MLIISPGYHSVTGNHGGAIENLINIYLKYNDNIKDCNEIVVYSPKISDEEFDNQIYNNTSFRIIDLSSKYRVLKQKIYNQLKKISVIDVRRIYFRYVVKDILKKKENNKYDIIIFENGQENIKYFRKKIKTKSKVVLHLHNDYLNNNCNNGEKILGSFDEIWTVSNFIKNRIEEIQRVPDKVKVLYNTIEYDKFNKIVSNDEKNELRTRYNISEKDFVFIYVGRIMEEKGVLELVQAFNILKQKYNAIKLIIVGGNKSLNNEGEYIESVRKEANGNVIFTGQIDNSDIYRYYSISKVQIIPSKWNEAFGLIALEGIASNLIIIASNSGGLPEVLGNTELLVDNNNLVNELVTKMEYVYKNKEKLEQLKMNYPGIIDKFSEKIFCETMHLLIKKL